MQTKQVVSKRTCHLMFFVGRQPRCFQEQKTIRHVPPQLLLLYFYCSFHIFVLVIPATLQATAGWPCYFLSLVHTQFVHLFMFSLSFLLLSLFISSVCNSVSAPLSLLYLFTTVFRFSSFYLLCVMLFLWTSLSYCSPSLSFFVSSLSHSINRNLVGWRCYQHSSGNRSAWFTFLIVHILPFYLHSLVSLEDLFSSHPGICIIFKLLSAQ